MVDTDYVKDKPLPAYIIVYHDFGIGDYYQMK